MQLPTSPLKLLFLVLLLGGLIPGLIYFNVLHWNSVALSDLALFDFSKHNNIAHSKSSLQGEKRNTVSGDEKTKPTDSSKHINAESSIYSRSGDHGSNSNQSHFSTGDVENGKSKGHGLMRNGTSETLVRQKTQETAANVSVTGLKSTSKKTDGSSANIIGPCPQTTPESVGRIAVNETAVTEAELNTKYKSINSSGHFKPAKCVNKDKTAVIIPYRQREKHLRILLNNLIPFLEKQQIEFSIFIVEPARSDKFNRALLLNVGFLEALKLDNFTCFVFHDVDLLPENDRNVYRCGEHPRHHATANSKFKYKLPYGGYAGGVIAMSREQFTKINGMSNLYFGWGGEDDDLYYRLVSRGYKLLRYPMEIGRYFALSHGRDKGNNVNSDRLKVLQHWRKRMDEDGLNSVKYTLNKLELKNLYTWVYISIDWNYYKSKLDKLIGR